VLGVLEVLYVAVVCGCSPVVGARGYAFPPVVETPRIIVDRPLDRVELRCLQPLSYEGGTELPLARSEFHVNPHNNRICTLQRCLGTTPSVRL